MSLVPHKGETFFVERQILPLSREFERVKMDAIPPLGEFEELEKCQVPGT